MHAPPRRRPRIRGLLSALAAACLTLGLLAATPAAADTAPPAAGGTSAAADATVQPYTPTGCNDPAQQAGHARCLSLVNTRTDQQAKARSAASGPLSTSLSPKQIQDAYKLPNGGEGRTVAIVDAFGDSRAEEDLAVYRAYYGLPACTTANGCFRKVDQRGGTDYPADDSGWATETALDVDAVSAACPNCKILLVQADDNSLDNLGAAVDTAVRLGAKYVSNSYGVDGEDGGETYYDHYYDHPGVVVTASAGDTGHVQNWPAANPNVVSVGGTRLTADSAADRGWTERAWTSGGSGCSLYEAKPAYQEGIDTGCDTRSTADLSADADPASGLGVYTTVGEDGWMQVGGTSLSAPLIAAMYALAGDPAPDTYPVTYPYAAGKGLNDITAGTNGAQDSCSDVTCTAGEGYDGPTGLGTPNGVGALAFGTSGTIAGRITDADGAPLADAVVRADGTGGTGADRTFHTTTGADGRYTLTAITGSYRVTASRFGYGDEANDGVDVAEGASATVDLSLAKTESRRISGTVTDGGEHGWPLAGRITIDGYPYGAVYTDPETGAYSVDLPKGASYRLHVTPLNPGYPEAARTVALGDDAATADFAVAPDREGCVAPGYSYGAAADFEGWTGTAPKDGWTVATTGPDSSGWRFDTPVGNVTGGSGNFAAATPFLNGDPAVDTVLASPVADLRGNTAQLEFDSLFATSGDGKAAVELSTDGGTTWQQVWTAANGDPGHASVALPQAADRQDVRIRFHLTAPASSGTLWEVDTVRLGTCAAVRGDLVTGTVTDGNTGKPVDGATVADKAAPQTTATSATTPGDTAHPGGRYTLFVPGTGKHTLVAKAARYTAGERSTAIGSGRVDHVDLTLAAGRGEAKPEVSFDARLGKKAVKTVTFRNTGRAAAEVSLGERSADPGTAKTAAGAGWQALPDYPEAVIGNVAATYRGKVYSVGGGSGAIGTKFTTHGYVYDPAAGSWRRIADIPVPVYGATAAFADGTLYVVGGGDSGTSLSSAVQAYHPDTDTWTRAASIPLPLKGAGIAVAGGRIYVVGGCTLDCATYPTTVQRYDPKTDRWSTAADYPKQVRSLTCAGVADEVICAGGQHALADAENGLTAAAYAYRPSADTWTRLADLPTPVMGASATGANGRMQVLGGFTEADNAVSAVTEYDPVSGVWTRLPDSLYDVNSGATACGLYEVGGGQGDRLYLTGAVRAEYLPGYDQCGGDDVAWLSENRTRFTLKPGKSVTVRVTADAGAVPAAGDYAADLMIGSDTPYTGRSVKLTLTAEPAGRG